MKANSLFWIIAVALAAATYGLAQPLITTQPADQTNYVGSTVTFAVAATGTGTVTYQWQRGTTNFTDIPNETNALFVLTSVQLYDAANYRVVVSDITGPTNSAVAHLFVDPVPTLSISQPSPGVVTLSWPGNMVLLATWNVSGTQPWSFDCAAWVRMADSSPFILTSDFGSPSPKFFRLIARSSIAALQDKYVTNLNACNYATDAQPCVDGVAAYLLSASLAALRPNAACEGAAAVGAALGSCISEQQLSMLVFIRFMWEGP